MDSGDKVKLRGWPGYFYFLYDGEDLAGQSTSWVRPWENESAAQVKVLDDDILPITPSEPPVGTVRGVFIRTDRSDRTNRTWARWKGHSVYFAYLDNWKTWEEVWELTR